MRQVQRTLVLILTTLMLGGCGAFGGAAMADVKLTEAHNGQVVSTRVGDTIALQLGENPTTGYKWEIKQIDPAILTQQGDDYQSGGTAPGSAGMRTITFRAAASGSTTLALSNERSWEPPSPNNQQWSATINVQAR